MPRTRPLASRVGNRRSRSAVALAAAVVLACTLTACTPPAAGDPAPSDAPATTSSAAPIFASDEEALAAAVAAYEAYSAASAIVANDGGRNSERIVEFVTPQLGEQVLDEFAALQDGGLRIQGEPRVYGARLAEQTVAGESAIVSAYFCRDIGETRVLREDGSDATPIGRDLIQPILAQFKSAIDDPSRLLLDGIERWSDDSHC